jgi:cytidylate kinase
MAGRAYCTRYNAASAANGRSVEKDHFTVTSPHEAAPEKTLIAIDGPAGAGKSTIAASLAARLGLPYLDTGAMYRAVGLIAMRDGLDAELGEESAARVVELMQRHTIDVAADVDGTRIVVDGEDVSTAIRSPECAMMASAVSALPEVRRALVPLQRQLGLANGGVMEGRDIGSVVLPDAHLKVYLTASSEERAKRRHRDLEEREIEATLEEVREQQQQRDRQDTSRADSPLQVSRGSIVLDTTELSRNEVVERLLKELEKVLRRPA